MADEFDPKRDNEEIACTNEEDMTGSGEEDEFVDVGDTEEKEKGKEEEDEGDLES